MKNIVINLERAAERREAMLEEFAHYGLDFEFFSGVDWLNLTEHDIRENVDSKYIAKSKKGMDPNSLPGILACWLSHRNLWKIAVTEWEVNSIAVFEDDASLTDDTKSALNVISNLEKQDIEFDIIFLYDTKRIKPLIPVHRIDDRFILNLVKYSSMGAVGYVISRRAMKILLKDYPLLNMGIDELMHWYWITGLKTYVLTPQVVFHGDKDRRHLHHSYSGESGISNKLLEWKQNNLGKYRNYKLLRATKSVLNFPSRLFFKYIPQRLVFRRRVKNEVLQKDIFL